MCIQIHILKRYVLYRFIAVGNIGLLRNLLQKDIQLFRRYTHRQIPIPKAVRRIIACAEALDISAQFFYLLCHIFNQSVKFSGFHLDIYIFNQLFAYRIRQLLLFSC